MSRVEWTKKKTRRPIIFFVILLKYKMKTVTLMILFPGSMSCRRRKGKRYVKLSWGVEIGLSLHAF
jgi:hypothetical protein